jgi:hypothetical protein
MRTIEQIAKEKAELYKEICLLSPEDQIRVYKLSRDLVIKEVKK